MDDLILTVLTGEATLHERRLLERWRNESSDNERHYQEVVRTWQLIPLHETAEPISSPPALASIVAAGDRRRRGTIPLRAHRTRRGTNRGWIVAVVATAAAAVFLVFAMPGLWDNPPDLLFSTGPNETRTISLEDGSVVRLGPGSRLEAWSHNARQAHFSGIGFFAVKSDSVSPFVLRTDVGTAEVYGTRFEIRATAGSLRLVVVEGSVSLSAGGDVVEATGGTMTSIAGGTPPTLPTEVDVRSLLDWQDGLLIFQDTQLRDVVSEVEAFFGIPFSILDSTLARRVVTAWFENETFEEVVGTICEVVGARCTLGESVEMVR